MSTATDTIISSRSMRGSVLFALLNYCPVLILTSLADSLCLCSCSAAMISINSNVSANSAEPAAGTGVIAAARNGIRRAVIATGTSAPNSNCWQYIYQPFGTGGLAPGEGGGWQFTEQLPVFDCQTAQLTEAPMQAGFGNGYRTRLRGG